MTYVPTNTQFTERCGKCYNEVEVKYVKTGVGLVVKRMTCKLHSETQEYIGTAHSIVKPKVSMLCPRCKEEAKKLVMNNAHGLICEPCHLHLKEHGNG